MGLEVGGNEHAELPALLLALRLLRRRRRAKRESHPQLVHLYKRVGTGGRGQRCWFRQQAQADKTNQSNQQKKRKKGKGQPHQCGGPVKLWMTKSIESSTS